MPRKPKLNKFNKGEIWKVNKYGSDFHILIIYAKKETEDKKYKGQYLIHGMQYDMLHKQPYSYNSLNPPVRRVYDLWMCESMMIEKVDTVESKRLQDMLIGMDMSVFYGKES